MGIIRRGQTISVEILRLLAYNGYVNVIINRMLYYDGVKVMKNSDSPDFMSAIKCIPGLDTAYAIKALGDVEPLYEKMLRKVLRLLPSNIEEMDKFLCENNDLDAFAVKVHGVKGSLGQVGCLTLSKRAESLEKAAKAGDRPYCDENYGPFKAELLHFYGQLNDADLQSAEAEDGADAGVVDGLADMLGQAKEAAENYDAISAADILLPLTKRRLGGGMDELILSAVDELEVFRPQKALKYIAELIDMVNRP